MFIKFWGTRGSVPTPGSSTIKYGGNTLCLQIVSKENYLIVMDCGTGAIKLGKHLLSKGVGEIKGHMLFSHTHWDHIQGVPFFIPLFIPKNTWEIYGPEGLTQSIHKSLSGQMQYQYFPITLEDFGATIKFHNLKEESFTIGDVNVKTHYLNHTCLNLGYRFESEGLTVVYSCDHEPYSLAMARGEGPLSDQELAHLEFIRDADLLIHDSQYTAEEYPQKIGWGHSTFEYVVRMSKEANVKNLAFNHHDPDRTDSALAAIEKKIQDQLKSEGSPINAFIAYEGQEIQLIPGDKKSTFNTERLPKKETKKSKVEEASKPLGSNYSILLYCSSPEIKKVLTESMEQENINIEIADNLESAKKIIAKSKPIFAIIEHSQEEDDGRKILNAISSVQDKNNSQVPIVLVGEEETSELPQGLEFVECWNPPFSISIIRTKLTRLILRTIANKPDRE